jgi:transposase-like protein
MALGIKPDGRREILGFWLFGAEGESAGNWEEVLKNLRRRGVQRVRIFISDDLPGLEEAIKKIFPEADRQLCVLHAVRAALNKARKKDREALAEALKKIYWAESREEAEEALRNPARTVGHGLSQDRGALGNHGLCPSCVFTSPQAHPKVSLYH